MPGGSTNLQPPADWNVSVPVDVVAVWGWCVSVYSCPRRLRGVMIMSDINGEHDNNDAGGNTHPHPTHHAST